MVANKLAAPPNYNGPRIYRGVDVWELYWRNLAIEELLKKCAVLLIKLQAQEMNNGR